MKPKTSKEIRETHLSPSPPPPTPLGSVLIAIIPLAIIWLGLIGSGIELVSNLMLHALGW